MTRKNIISVLAALVVVVAAGAAGYGWWGARSSTQDFRFGKVERGGIT